MRSEGFYVNEKSTVFTLVIDSKLTENIVFTDLFLHCRFTESVSAVCVYYLIRR